MLECIAALNHFEREAKYMKWNWKNNDSRKIRHVIFSLRYEIEIYCFNLMKDLDSNFSLCLLLKYYNCLFSIFVFALLLMRKQKKSYSLTSHIAFSRQTSGHFRGKRLSPLMVITACCWNSSSEVSGSKDNIFHKNLFYRGMKNISL